MRLSYTPNRARLWALALLPAVVACAFAGGPLPARFEFTQVHMGTTFNIIVYAPDRATAARACEAASKRVDALDHIMSDYLPTSELNELSQKAGGPPVEVSDDLYRVLEKAQAVAHLSEGAFDVTVGPAVRLWRRARRQRELPEPAALAHALRLVGFEKLLLDPTARTVQLREPGMQLDVGGIAKGDAADQAMLVLTRYGISSALVAAGGDIVASNAPPGKPGWQIAVTPLDSPQAPPARLVLLHNQAISTSGEAEQHVEIAGVRYSHIVDPKTGMALTGRRSVTVIAREGITADSLATALNVLAPERGLELIKSIPGTSALIVVSTNRGLETYVFRFPMMTPPTSK